VTVCQVGEGADELFAGYTSWLGMMRLQQRLQRQPYAGLAHAMSPGLRRIGARGGFRAEYLRRYAAGRPVFWGGAEAFTEAEKHDLLSPRLRSELRGMTSWDAIAPIRQRYEAKAWERSDLHWMTYLDLNLRLPELLLMRVDKMSMGASLECRVPFLDHEFVSHALSIPTEVKMRLGRKGLLRHAVRGVVPDEIIDRPKQGFGLPVGDMLAEGLGANIREQVAQFCAETDLLDARGATAAVDRGGAAGWYIYNLALWWQHYVART
jgi:asparagine synthase (glutamine-hydrolysing)